MRRAWLACLALAGCAGVPAAPDGEDHPLAWMSGCWVNAGGDYREVWSAPDHGYLFGYALSLNGEDVVFFEQTRITPGEMFTMDAYPGGSGPSPFPEAERGETSITFANPDHDYPQRIHYERKGDRMTAEISLIDGSKAQDFSFRRCSD
jgi:hypothetical protein